MPRSLNLPLVPWAPVHWSPAVRLVSRERAVGRAFERVAEAGEPAVMAALVADLTNPAVASGAARYLALPPEDRVTGPGAGLILGPFCFGTTSTRFSDGSFGVWYGASCQDTATAERQYHTGRALAAGGVGPVTLELAVIHVTLDGLLADVRGRRATDLAPLYDPVSYHAAQQFGAEQRHRGAFGIVYDSVRDARGECTAVFRPRILQVPEIAGSVTWRWDGAQLLTHP